MPQKHNWSLRLFSSQNLSLPLAVCVCLCVNACGCWCGCWCGCLCVCIHMCDYYICLINLPLDQICPAKLQRCTLIWSKSQCMQRNAACEEEFLVVIVSSIPTNWFTLSRYWYFEQDAEHAFLVGISWNYNQLELRKQWNACSSKKAALSSVHEYM